MSILKVEKSNKEDGLLKISYLFGRYQPFAIRFIKVARAFGIEDGEFLFDVYRTFFGGLEYAVVNGSAECLLSVVKKHETDGEYKKFVLMFSELHRTFFCSFSPFLNEALLSKLNVLVDCDFSTVVGTYEEIICDFEREILEFKKFEDFRADFNLSRLFGNTSIVRFLYEAFGNFLEIDKSVIISVINIISLSMRRQIPEAIFSKGGIEFFVCLVMTNERNKICKFEELCARIVKYLSFPSMFFNHNEIEIIGEFHNKTFQEVNTQREKFFNGINRKIYKIINIEQFIGATESYHEDEKCVFSPTRGNIFLYFNMIHQHYSSINTNELLSCAELIESYITCFEETFFPGGAEAFFIFIARQNVELGIDFSKSCQDFLVCFTRIGHCFSSDQLAFFKNLSGEDFAYINLTYGDFLEVAYSHIVAVNEVEPFAIKFQLKYKIVFTSNITRLYEFSNHYAIEGYDLGKVFLVIDAVEQCICGSGYTSFNNFINVLLATIGHTEKLGLRIEMYKCLDIILLHPSCCDTHYDYFSSKIISEIGEHHFKTFKQLDDCGDFLHRVFLSLRELYLSREIIVKFGYELSADNVLHAKRMYQLSECCPNINSIEINQIHGVVTRFVRNCSGPKFVELFFCLIFVKENNAGTNFLISSYDEFLHVLNIRFMNLNADEMKIFDDMSSETLSDIVLENSIFFQRIEYEIREMYEDMKLADECMIWYEKYNVTAVRIMRELFNYSQGITADELFGIFRYVSVYIRGETSEFILVPGGIEVFYALIAINRLDGMTEIHSEHFDFYLNCFSVGNTPFNSSNLMGIALFEGRSLESNVSEHVEFLIFIGGIIEGLRNARVALVGSLERITSLSLLNRNFSWKTQDSTSSNSLSDNVRVPYLDCALSTDALPNAISTDPLSVVLPLGASEMKIRDSVSSSSLSDSVQTENSEETQGLDAPSSSLSDNVRVPYLDCALSTDALPNAISTDSLSVVLPLGASEMKIRDSVSSSSLSDGVQTKNSEETQGSEVSLSSSNDSIKIGNSEEAQGLDTPSSFLIGSDNSSSDYKETGSRFLHCGVI